MLLALAAGPCAAQPAQVQPEDAQLERLVRIAYAAAAGHARRNQNYFAADGGFDPLREAIRAALASAGYERVWVPPAPFDDVEGAMADCVPLGTELRIATTIFGDSIALAAVGEQRAFGYHYDPREGRRITVLPAQDCS